MTSTAAFPAIDFTADYSRVPFTVYHDAAVFERERDSVFRGPVWNYALLEAEISQPGDFRTIQIGDVPVVAGRDTSGELYAFVNRCAHRGAAVRREVAGNAPNHVCIYHRWCYSQRGALVGVPLRRGVKGQGGLDASFNMADHGLEQLRVESYRGVVFVSFSDQSEPLVDYLGPMICLHLDTIFNRPIKILGYQRQTIAANWKLYNENLRDTYHASLLHEFLVTFGIDRATQKGGVSMDARHRHNLTYAYANTDSASDAKEAYGAHGLPTDRISLRDPALLALKPEFTDGLGMATSCVFPNAAFQRLNNSLATRQIRPQGIDQTELYWTYFGYADDDDDMTAHRLIQSNLVGPAGFVSMEDAEALEIAQRATSTQRDARSVIEMGGKGALHDCDYRVTEIPVRGFWSYYAELMGVAPEGAVR